MRPTSISVTAPVVEPVTADEALAYCRVDDIEETQILDGLIMAARESVELGTERALISQQFLLAGRTWRKFLTEDRRRCRDLYLLSVLLPELTGNYGDCHNVILMDRSPVLSIDSVQYYDASNTLQTLAPSSYYPINLHTPLAGALHPNPRPGAFALSSLASWPTLFDRPDAVQIKYTAGYGTTSDMIPQSLRHAVLMMVKHLYDNRDAYTIGSGSVLEMPFGIRHMLDSRKAGGWVS